MNIKTNEVDIDKRDISSKLKEIYSTISNLFVIFRLTIKKINFEFIEGKMK